MTQAIQILPTLTGSSLVSLQVNQRTRASVTRGTISLGLHQRDTAITWAPIDASRRGAWSKASTSGRRNPSICVRAGIRAVETYDASFELQPECDQVLRQQLGSKVFCDQVAEQSMSETNEAHEFTGEIFQPVPWSPATKYGMPEEYEKFLKDKENFTIINVPPNFMFKAKIFKPSRLCAVYKKV